MPAEEFIIITVMWLFQYTIWQPVGTCQEDDEELLDEARL